MASTSNATKKRRKTAPPSDGDGAVRITDLTDDLLVSIAAYLPAKTSRALLAVALTAPSSSWREVGLNARPSGASKAIVASVKPSAPCPSLVEDLCREYNDSFASEQTRARRSKNPYDSDWPRLRNGRLWEKQKHDGELFKAGLAKQLEAYFRGEWEVLDFVDLERALASRLSDDDLAAVLVCINARNNLSRLILTRCSSIVGHGLSPLRSSSTLEELDLGLSRHIEVPAGSTKFSEHAVLPILNDILCVEANSFRRLQVPMDWCEGFQKGPKKSFAQFLDGHTHMLNVSSLCSYFGFNSDTKEQFEQLQRRGETEIDPVERCMRCHWDAFIFCAHCEGVVCECMDPATCDSCDVAICQKCLADARDLGVTLKHKMVPYCDWCSADNYCARCKLQSCMNGVHCCDRCMGPPCQDLLEQNDSRKAEIDVLEEEINEYQAEIASKRETIEEMQAVIENLRRELSELRP